MLRFALVFTTSFFISINYGALIYVNSTFLENFFSPEIVSALYLIGAVGNIILFFLAPRLLRRFRKETLLISALLLAVLGTLGLALAENALVAGLSFILYTSVLFMTYYCLDISLEELSPNHHTGAIRGLYYTFVNGGIALGPLLVSLLVKEEALEPLYFIGSFILLSALITALFMHGEPWQALHRKYHQSLSLPFRAWWKKRNVRAVTLAKLVLETFFAIMTIYTPLYLHQHLGFSWSELGIIFTIMLLPFVLLEWPAGGAADHWWGEKEMMTLGFFLTGTMLLLMAFLDQSFTAWLIVLLLSRVGASLTEVTTESYFFKKISMEDTGMLGIFRLTRPISIILGALIGAVTLNLFSFEKIFVIAAILVFFGMKESLYLKDTL